MDSYPKTRHKIEIMGNSDDDYVYIDYDADEHKIGEGDVQKVYLYKIR